MRWIFLFVSLALASLLVLGPSALNRDAVGSPGSSRIGVFDSRALPIAFAASDIFDRELTAHGEKIEAAREAGDEALADQLMAMMPARHQRMARQTFSTASVDDILAHIEDRIPKVAQEAGVAVVVSKWDLAYVESDLELVDVTEALVALFDPDDRVLRQVRSLKDLEPMPLYETDWDAMEGH